MHHLSACRGCCCLVFFLVFTVNYVIFFIKPFVSYPDESWSCPCSSPLPYNLISVPDFYSLPPLISQLFRLFASSIKPQICFCTCKPHLFCQEVYQLSLWIFFFLLLFLYYSERVSSQSQRRFPTEMGMPTTGQTDEKLNVTFTAFVQQVF